MAAKKVLVVDDSTVQRNNLAQIIEDAGFVVVKAESGKQSIESAVNEQPDLIFMDIIMPEMDGYEACRHLTRRDDTKHIPVVFVTTKDQKADQVWAKMQGGKGFVVKPYSEDEITDQLKSYL